MAVVEVGTRVDVRCRRCGVQTGARDFDMARSLMRNHSSRADDTYSCVAQSSELDYAPLVEAWLAPEVDEEPF